MKPHRASTEATQSLSHKLCRSSFVPRLFRNNGKIRLTAPYAQILRNINALIELLAQPTTATEGKMYVQRPVFHTALISICLLHKHPIKTHFHPKPDGEYGKGKGTSVVERPFSR